MGEHGTRNRKDTPPMPTTYLIRNTIPTDDDSDALEYADAAQRIEEDAKRLGLDPFTYCETVLADEHYGSNA